MENKYLVVTDKGDFKTDTYKEAEKIAKQSTRAVVHQFDENKKEVIKNTILFANGEKLDLLD